MHWLIQAVVMGALIELKCPHCGKMQVRARKAKGTEYRCKSCHARFKREEGEKRKNARRR